MTQIERIEYIKEIHGLKIENHKLKEELTHLRQDEKRLRDVCQNLVWFQEEYETNTGSKMPGNEYYAATLMQFVEKAKQAIDAEMEGKGE